MKTLLVAFALFSNVAFADTCTSFIAMPTSFQDLTECVQVHERKIKMQADEIENLKKQIRDMQTDINTIGLAVASKKY